MTPIPDDSQGNSSRERQVNELIALYLRAVERGDDINPHSYIGLHPQFASELSRFFADRDKFRSDASPSLLDVSSASTSTSLLARVKANETDAWLKLSRLYGPLVYNWTRRMNLQSSDAADVVQEVFLAVSLHVTQFRRDRPNDSFRGWLWTITRNKVRDHFRRQGRQLTAEGGSEANARILELPDCSSDDDASVGGTSERAQLTHRMVELVRAEFPLRSWQAFWRTAVDGRPASEVADELGMNVGAVYMSKSRVLTRLRQELSGLMED